MSKLCNSCRWWEKVYQHAGKEYGHCDHPVASVKMVVEHSQQEHGNTGTFTEGYFGCIYWEGQAGKTLIRFDKHKMK